MDIQQCAEQIQTVIDLQGVISTFKLHLKSKQSKQKRTRKNCNVHYLADEMTRLSIFDCKILCNDNNDYNNNDNLIGNSNFHQKNKAKNPTDFKIVQIKSNN